MIRTVNNNDLDLIVKLEEDNLESGSLGYAFLAQELNENPFSTMLILEENQQVIGYISYRVVDQTAEILNLVIDKPYHRQGYGYQLLTYVMDQLKEKAVKTLILEVRASNMNAQYLYYKCGFKRILSRPNYYQNEDGYVFLWENKQ